MLLSTPLSPLFFVVVIHYENSFVCDRSATLPSVGLLNVSIFLSFLFILLHISLYILLPFFFLFLPLRAVCLVFFFLSFSFCLSFFLFSTFVSFLFIQPRRGWCLLLEVRFLTTFMHVLRLRVVSSIWLKHRCCTVHPNMHTSTIGLLHLYALHSPHSLKLPAFLSFFSSSVFVLCYFSF